MPHDSNEKNWVPYFYRTGNLMVNSQVCLYDSRVIIIIHYYKTLLPQHDDVIKWKHFPRYWPFVRGIHRSPVNSPHKGQWRGALMFYFICVWINSWVNNREAGDLRPYRAHYDVTVMSQVNMVVPYGKAPIWYQDINSHHDDMVGKGRSGLNGLLFT